MAVTDWLIDKSALVRLGNSPDAKEWAGRVERALVSKPPSSPSVSQS